VRVCFAIRHATGVVINEALELARTFSTEESVKFINGMWIHSQESDALR